MIEGTWWGLSAKQQTRIAGLSVLGCYVESLAQPQVGERLHVSLHLADGALTLEGEVVYCEPGMGFALRFIDMPAAHHAKLNAAVHALLTSS